MCSCCSGCGKLIYDATGWSMFKPAGSLDALRSSMMLSKQTKGGPVDIGVLLLHLDPNRPIKDFYNISDAQLGSGAFGSVYSATHKRTEEKRAVKSLNMDEITEDPDLLVTEAQAMIELDHPNIIKLYEYFQDSEHVYFVMDVIQGGSLMQYITAPMQDIRTLFTQLAEGVAYCHGHGLTHRDLKMDNCLVFAEQGSPMTLKIIDFGLSAITKKAGEKHTDVLGSAPYVAPEVVSGRPEGYDSKCDVFSMGVMLYILCCDAHPFINMRNPPNEMELFQLIQTAKPKDKPMEDRNLDETLRKFIKHMLQNNPSDSPNSEAVLRNEWVRPSRNDQTRKSAIGDQRERLCHMKEFAKYDHFQRAILTYTAHLAQERDLQAARKAFTSIDKSGDGCVDRAELESGLATAGCPAPSKEDIDEIFKALDSNNTGKIEWTEYLAATLRPSIMKQKRALDGLFELFDENHDGYISKDELEHLIGEDDAKRVLEQADSKTGGKLSRNDFEELIKKICETMPFMGVSGGD